MSLRDEILGLMAQHADRAVDFPALYILLNTAAGGQYLERHAEPAVLAALDDLCARGAVAATPSAADAAVVVFCLTSRGRALLSGDSKEET